MRLICILIVAIFLSSCGGTNEAEKTKQDNIALVEKYVQAVQKKDTKTMSDLLSEDYKGYGPSIYDSCNKAEAIENWKNLAENLYDKIEYIKSVNVAARVDDAYHPGDFVSNWAHLIIRYKDGRGPVTILSNTNYRIENGKITMTRTIYNEADALLQLGYQIVPAQQ
jgi:hypothetical protein